MPSKKLVKNISDKPQNKWAFSILLISGLLGLVASFVLTLDKLAITAQPDAILQCSINLVLNCSTVMQTWQSALFGFPNMYIGMMAFPVIITLGVAGLWGVKFPNLFMKIANLVVLLATVFSYWLLFQSVYVIEVLCPWCLIVSFSMTIMIAAITNLNARSNNLGLPQKQSKKVAQFYTNGWDNLIVASWIVVLIVLIYLKFGSSLFA